MHARTFLFYLLCLLTLQVQAATKTVFFAWDDNPEPDITNYVVSLGTVPGRYWWSKDISPTNQITLTNILDETTARASIANLREGNVYYVVVQAQNAQGELGDFSDEVVVSFDSGPSTKARLILTTHILSSTNGVDWQRLGSMEFVSGLIDASAQIKTTTSTNFVMRPSP